MIGEILSLIPSIIGLFNSNSAHDEYGNELKAQQARQKLSESALQAKGLFAENATRGLAGYDTMKEDINNRLPETLNASKDWLTSGGAVDFLARASAATNQSLRQLDAANAQQKQENQQMYANYLGGAMANQENQLLQNQTQLGVAAGYNQADKAASGNKYMFGMGNALAGIADKDLAAIIAALSKDKNNQSQGSYKQLDGISPDPYLNSINPNPYGIYNG